MAKILFVDNRHTEFDRFQKLFFCSQHQHEIEHVRSPVDLATRVKNDAEIRLVILDVLWEESGEGGALELGADAMRQFAKINVDVPIVMYSGIDDEPTLRRLIPEMMQLGAYDWICKDDNIVGRSLRFERAYAAGRGWRQNQPKSQEILPIEGHERTNIHVATLFVDLSGFTAITDQIGAGPVVELLRTFYQLVGEPVSKNGGYVDKYIGDAVMALFGVYDHDDQKENYAHAQACINTARSIVANSQKFRLEQVEPLLTKYASRFGNADFDKIGRVRIGCESGAVNIVRFERGNESEITAVGTAVNIAARVMAKAGPDEAWIGQNLARLSPGAVLAETKEVEYKNLPGTFSIHRLRI